MPAANNPPHILSCVPPVYRTSATGEAVAAASEEQQWDVCVLLWPFVHGWFQNPQLTQHKKGQPKPLPQAQVSRTVCKNTSSSNTNVLWRRGQIHLFSCAVSNNPQAFSELRDEYCHDHTKAIYTTMSFEIHPHTGRSAKSSSFHFCSFFRNTQWGLFYSQFQHSKAGLSPPEVSRQSAGTKGGRADPQPDRGFLYLTAIWISHYSPGISCFLFFRGY